MKTKLHRIYYLLALIDVITIVITLVLAYSIYQAYAKSFIGNESWTYRAIKYDDLTSLTINANAPGNNVFTSLNIKK